LSGDSPLRAIEPGRTILTILNGGRMSRCWLIGLGNAAIALGLRHTFIEGDEIARSVKTDPDAVVREFSKVLIQRKIGLVLNYALNGAAILPVDQEWPGAYRNFFEVRGIPQFILWADHPQWVSNKDALRPDIQAAFRSGNQFHFLKSQAHAQEIRRILGWPNCHAVACGADPKLLTPRPEIQPDYDLIAIYGNDVTLPDWLLPFLEQDDPDPAAINQIVAKQVREKLGALWDKEAALSLRPELDAWSNRAIELKLTHPEQSLARHFGRLTDEFPMASWWLAAMFPTYFKATEILYAFRNWQRHFYLAYLSKYFRVGLFGGKWSHVGNPAEAAANGHWVDFDRIPQFAARGKIALDIVSGWDEEGLTAKTFELAACGKPMIHNDCIGLEEAFEPAKEIEIFRTPKQARQMVQHLLDDPSRREGIAQASRARLLKEHTWGHRLQQMLEKAGLPVDAFR
jgi:hypothetical protein